MRGVKSNEDTIYKALSDSFASIEQVYLNDRDLMTTFEYKQLKGILNILEANREALSPYGLSIIEGCKNIVRAKNQDNK